MTISNPLHNLSAHPKRLVRRALLTGIPLALLCFTASAPALTGHHNAETPFTGIDNPNFPSGFGSPQGVAVDNDPSSPNYGDVYVVDTGDAVVDRFTPAGAFICQISATAGVPSTTVCGDPVTPQAPSGFNPYGVAVDPTTGDLYVTDIGNNTVDKFDANGVLLYSLDGVTPPGNSPAAFRFPAAVAVDGTGDVYVADEGNDVVDKFDATGIYLSQIIEPGSVYSVAVDTSPDPSDPSTGDIYIVNTTLDGSSTVTQKYSPSGTLLSLIENNGSDHAVVVDAAGYVYVVRTGENTGVYQYDSAGNPFFQFGGALQIQSIAYSNLTGNIYTSDSSGEVDIFTPFTFSGPKLVALPATNISRGSATLQGTLNPEDFTSAYHFEYVSAADYLPGTADPYANAQIAPAPDGTVEPGSIPPAVALSLPVNGLQPNTLYHYRLVASNRGGSGVSGDQTFTTGQPLPPTAATGGASGVSADTATISGTVDPNGLPTHYQFELGPAGSFVTQVYGDAHSEPEALPVSASFTGLAPSTTYQYRIVATNTDGVSAGSTQTFTTASGPSATLPVPPNFGDFTGLTPVPAGREAAGESGRGPKPLSRAQKLKRALNACRRDKNNTRRRTCERQARKRFGPAGKKAKRSAITNQTTQQAGK